MRGGLMSGFIIFTGKFHIHFIFPYLHESENGGCRWHAPNMGRIYDDHENFDDLKMVERYQWHKLWYNSDVEYYIMIPFSHYDDTNDIEDDGWRWYVIGIIIIMILESCIYIYIWSHFIIIIIIIKWHIIMIYIYIWWSQIFRFIIPVIPMRWLRPRPRRGQETGRIFLRGEPPFRETCDMRLGRRRRSMGGWVGHLTRPCEMSGRWILMIHLGIHGI